MTEYPLELAYRGDRKYLHGTDLYKAVQDAAIDSEIQISAPFSFQFRSLLRAQPDLIWVDEMSAEFRNNPALKAEFHCNVDGELRHAGILESTRQIEERKVCNEKDVASTGEVDLANRIGTMVGGGCGNTIEKIVFLNKKMHSEVLDHVKQRWLFAKLEISVPFEASTELLLSLKMRQVLADRLTRTEIFLEDQSCGFITFSTEK